MIKRYGLCLTVVLAMVMVNPADIFIKTTIYDQLSAPGAFTKVTRLFAQTRMDAQLVKGLEKRTVFVPTDDAFDEFGRMGLLEGPENADRKIKFASFLVCPNVIRPEELRKDNSSFPSSANAPIRVEDIGKVLYYIEVDNGMIYVINKVPVHPDLRSFLQIKN